MKFKTYLEQISNVEIYPLISLVLFTSIFIGVIFYVFTASNESMDTNANIPLN